MKERRYSTDLLKTVNNLTGKATYYARICDVFARISKEEYEQRTNEAFGLSCLYNTTSKKYNRFYKTVTNYIQVKG